MKTGWAWEFVRRNPEYRQDYLSEQSDAEAIYLPARDADETDKAVQIAGHDLLKDRGIELIPVDAPDHFTDETPTAVMVRQILGAVSEFEKASLVQKLRKARERKRVETGRCEGRKPVPEEVVKQAKRLRRKSPRTGKRLSLRRVAAALADMGHTALSGRPYGAESVKQMVAK